MIYPRVPHKALTASAARVTLSTPAIPIVTQGGLVAVDGSGNVQVASPSGLPLGDFTVELYAIWDGLTVEGGLIGVWNFPGQFSWLFSIDSLGRPQLRYSYNNSTSNGPVQPSTGNLVATQTHHVAFTVSGGTSVKFYIDGALMGSAVALAGSGDFGAHLAPLDWGRDNDNSVALTGDVGPTRIIDAVLSDAEIAANYNVATPNLPPAILANVVSSWDMQSGLADSIGSNTAALTGTASQTDDAFTYPP